MKIVLKIFLVLVLVVLLTAYFTWRKFEKEAFSGVAGVSNVSVEFEVKEGEGPSAVGENLQMQKLIKDQNYFYYYVWKTETGSKLQAGVYELAPNMTIGQMVEKMTDGEVKSKIVKLTVPEGFNNKKIVGLLREKKPTIADEFEKIATCKCLNQAACECDVFSKKYDFLSQIPIGVDMEGYLFPDTYFIDEEETGTTLISKFLNNFDKKVDKTLRSEIARQKKTLHETITLASVVEREVKTARDMKIVAGIFADRLDDNVPLQSCATLAYFMGVDKPQFSYEDTQTESVYNTYINPGLPPGPISNPGLASIGAAVYPEITEYYYFLSNPTTGEIIYSKTIDEHNQRKNENGL